MSPKICPLDPEGLVYDINENVGYHLVIVHRFSEVNTKTDELSYYITLNDDRIFYPDFEEQFTNIYQPELISITQNSENEYVSVYFINVLRSKITENSSDKVRLNLILPF